MCGHICCSEAVNNMGIVLTGLKIIGIILLALLGLFLVLVAVLLFVPLRYGVQITREKESEEPLLRLTMSWLLHLIGVRAWLSTPTRWGVRVRAAKWTLLRLGQEEQEATQAEANAETAAKPVALPKMSAQSEDTPDEDTPVDTARTDSVPKILPRKAELPEVNSAPQTDTTQEQTPKEKPWEKIHLGERLGRVRDVLFALPGKVIDLVMGLIFALQDGEEALDDWIDAQQKKLDKFAPFWTAESKSWYNKVLTKLRRCARHYRPRRWQGYIEGGTGSADTTAIAAGVLYRFIPEAGGRVEIRPDFDALTVETRLSMRGHIRACHLVWFALQILVDRESWRMLRKVRPRKKKGE